MSFYSQYKSTINIGVGVAAIFIGYSIYKNNQRKKDEEKARAAADLAATELQQLAQQGVKPTYQDSQFQVFVDQLVQAMSDCGTDEDMIMNVFRSMKNDADIRKLISQFGVQYYQPCSFTDPIAATIYQFNNRAYGGALSTWLSYDLSASDITKINQLLQSKGINYQF